MRPVRVQGGKGQSGMKPRCQTRNWSNQVGSTGKGGSEAMVRKTGTHLNAATKEQQSLVRCSWSSGCRYDLSQKT